MRAGAFGGRQRAWRRLHDAAYAEFGRLLHLQDRRDRRVVDEIGRLDEQHRVAHTNAVPLPQRNFSAAFDLLVVNFCTPVAAEVFDPKGAVFETDPSVRPRDGEVRRQIEVDGHLSRLRPADDDRRRRRIERLFLSVLNLKIANTHGG